MNLIPVIRESLGLQENEEFNLNNDCTGVFPGKFRFTDSTLQIKEGERCFDPKKEEICEPYYVVTYAGEFRFEENTYYRKQVEE